MDELLIGPDVLARIATYLPRLPAAVLVLFFSALAIRLVVRLVDKIMRAAHMNLSLVSLVRSLLTFGGWILGFSAALQALGLTQIALALGGSLALVAMAVAGAASGSVADIIAGVFLVADPDFNVGTTVEVVGVSGLAGVVGEVRSIDMTRTRIMTDNGRLYLVPNRSLHSGSIIVNPRLMESGPR
jgi:small-conductance mechanosensitive channel